MTIESATAKTYAQVKQLNEEYETLRYEPAGQIPWYRFAKNSQWYQGWYDDSLSLALKYDLALNENLGGIGFWALGYDGGHGEIWGGVADYLDTELSPIRQPREDIQLIAAYPNPFYGTVTIVNNAPSDFGGNISVHIHSLTGKRIQTLLSDVSATTFQQVDWDGVTTNGESVSSGIYFIRAETRFMNQTIKVTYLK